MKYPENLEQKLGFDKIRHYLSSSCDTLWAKEYCDAFDFSVQQDEIKKRLAETLEFTHLLDFEKTFDWSAPNDLRKEIARARVPGTYLPATSIVDIRDNYKAVSKLLAFFAKTKDDQYLHLKQILSGVKVFPFVLDKIDQVFNKQGNIKDSASKELHRIRTAISQKSQGISKRIHKIVDTARSEGWVDQDTGPTLRDGRLVIPVPVTHKRRINGLIHDESATGKTVYIEPVELIELNNEIRELEIAEGREIIRILLDLTEAIRPYFDEILTWPELIGEFDFIRAKSKLCKRWDGQTIDVSDKKELGWKSARHPLLVLSYAQAGKKVVPQDIHLDQNNRILLISGPNAGGKSVCLKTVGIVQYIIQCGLLPPVQEGSYTTVFSDLFIDIGDDQSIENDLSTYSSHLLSMKHFVKNAGPDSLILIDEFGTGTEPQLGAAISQAILGQLNSTGAFGVITTHYSNLKHFAASEKGIINGAMLYDAQHMKPLFRLEIGKPGSSFAFEIAQQIGLPSEILDKAREQVGSDYIKFDKHLREISRDKRYWEKKRDQIKKQEKQLVSLLANYEELVKDFEKEKKRRIKEVQAEGEMLLNQINKRIENTVQEIRKQQADKEKMKAERARISEFANQTRSEFKNKISNSDKAVKQVLDDQEKIKSKHLSAPEERLSKEQASKRRDPETSILVPGSKVRIVDQEAVGEVLKVNRKTALLSIGEILTTIPHDKLLVISEKEFSAKNSASGKKRSGGLWQEMETKRLHFSPNVDIRGVRAEEALHQIQDIIDEAVMFGEKHLRILHGKGNGILRQVIREYLSSIDVVKSVRDEDIRFGGSGISLVELEY